MCLAGPVVASWSLTHEVACSSPFTVVTNIFVTEFAELSETFRKKLQCVIGVVKSLHLVMLHVTLTSQESC